MKKLIILLILLAIAATLVFISQQINIGKEREARQYEPKPCPPFILAETDAVEEPKDPQSRADIIFYNGDVLTIDKNFRVTQALAVKGNSILAVGSNEDILALAGSSTQKIDLKCHTLMPGFVDGHMHLLGKLFENMYTLDEAQDLAFKYGFTTISEKYADKDLVDFILRAEQDGDMRLRVNFFPSYNAAKLDKNKETIILESWYPKNKPILAHERMVRIPGIKIFVDGAFGGEKQRGAWAVSVPFQIEKIEEQGWGWPYGVADSEYGNLYWAQDELNAAVKDAQDAGYRVALHAVGDRAIETTLNAIEYALMGESNADVRHQIEHNIYLRPDLIDRYVKLDILASLRGYFSTCSQEAYMDTFPDTYTWIGNRYSLPRLGVRAYLETDFGWEHYKEGDKTRSQNINPFVQLYGLVTKKQDAGGDFICEPEEWLAKHRLSVEQALRLMTMGGAYAVSQEEVIGSLEPGKFADLIIVSDNPMLIDPDLLKDVEVKMTMASGKTEYCASEQASLCPEHNPNTKKSSGL